MVKPRKALFGVILLLGDGGKQNKFWKKFLLKTSLPHCFLKITEFKAGKLSSPSEVRKGEECGEENMGAGDPLPRVLVRPTGRHTG